MLDISFFLFFPWEKENCFCSILSLQKARSDDLKSLKKEERDHETLYQKFSKLFHLIILGMALTTWTMLMILKLMTTIWTMNRIREDFLVKQQELSKVFLGAAHRRVHQVQLQLREVCSLEEGVAEEQVGPAEVVECLRG